MSRDLYGELDLNGNKITGVADGVDPSDAVNKSQLEANSDHGSLTGLTDDDHSQYPLMFSQNDSPGTPTPNDRPVLWWDEDDNSGYHSTGVISLADGAPVPPGTPAGTTIVRYTSA